MVSPFLIHHLIITANGFLCNVDSGSLIHSIYFIQLMTNVSPLSIKIVLDGKMTNIMTREGSKQLFSTRLFRIQCKLILYTVPHDLLVIGSLLLYQQKRQNISFTMKKLNDIHEIYNIKLHVDIQK